MKFEIFIICLLFLLPFVSAAIEITSAPNDVYNLGENIAFSFKIIPKTGILKTK